MPDPLFFADKWPIGKDAFHIYRLHNGDRAVCLSTSLCGHACRRNVANCCDCRPRAYEPACDICIERRGGV